LLIKYYYWQEAAWQRLAAMGDRMPHAILLHGRRGIGKLHFAQVLAQSLLCEKRQTDGLACGSCAACAWFAAGNHPDFRLIQPEALAKTEDAADQPEESEEGKKKSPSKQIKIDQLRALTDFLNVGGHRGGHRVVLMHPAEAMNANTANSLLKSLEEPSAGVIYLLVSHQPRRLLATVRSRCHALGFTHPPRELAQRWLAEQGSSASAASLAFAGDAPLEAALVEEDELAARRKLFGLLCQPAGALSLSECCQRLQPGMVASWMLKWSYDLVAVASAGKVRYNPDYEKQLQQLVLSMPKPGLLRFQATLLGMKAVAEHPLNARLFFDDLFIAYKEIGQHG
jgi:DNA polymerase-3 subunit delta'